MAWSQLSEGEHLGIKFGVQLVESLGGGAVRVGVVLPQFQPIWLGDVPLVPGGTAEQARAKGMTVAAWVKSRPDELAQLLDVANTQAKVLVARAANLLSDAERGWPLQVEPGSMFSGTDLWVFMTLERKKQAFQTTPLVSGGGLMSTRLRYDGTYHVETIIPEMDLNRMANDLLAGDTKSPLPARFTRALSKSDDLLAEALAVLVFQTQGDPEYQALSLEPAIHEAKAGDFVELLGVLPVEYETAAVLVQARVQDALRVMRTHMKELQTWPTVQEKLRTLG